MKIHGVCTKKISWLMTFQETVDVYSASSTNRRHRVYETFCSCNGMVAYGYACGLQLGGSVFESPLGHKLS